LRNTFAAKLLKIAIEDPSIILITGDLGFGVLDEFAESLPKQYINAGIAEQSMMSMAAGIASQGFRPFVYSIANFPIMRCLEQIRNDICYMNKSVTIVSVGAGLSYGNLGYSHHGIEDISVIRSLPNIKLYSPADSEEVELCMDQIYQDDKPSYLRLGKGNEEIIHNKPLIRNFENIVLKQGDYGTIAFTGSIGSRILKAVESLNRLEIYPRIVSMPFLSEYNLIKLLEISKGEPMVTIEEHSNRGGFGSWLLEIANNQRMPINVKRLDLDKHDIYKLGTGDFLLNEANLSVDHIIHELNSHLVPKTE
jgi:transketolase